ncbi:MAG: acyl-CoA thioesterase [Myxococcales bacterium]|nr:acyl-CoA thioesterase [Myxococcales bacterium]
MSTEYTEEALGSEGYRLVNRHLVMSRDLNAFGNLFGGVMLSWLDESSALYVIEAIGYDNVVTVSMDNIVFVTPVHLGDSVQIYCRTQDLGRSSILVETKACVFNMRTGEQQEVITCQIKFVCLHKGRPFRYFETDTYKNYAKKRATAPSLSIPG